MSSLRMVGACGLAMPAAAVLGLMVVGCAGAGASEGATPARSAPRLAVYQPNEVRELQAQRLEVLRQIHGMLENQYESGRASGKEVLEAQRVLLAAELEMTEARDERIAIMEKLVEAARQSETVATEQMKIGRSSQVDVLNATAARLEAEIAVARARGQE